VFFPRIVSVAKNPPHLSAPHGSRAHPQSQVMQTYQNSSLRDWESLGLGNQQLK